MCYLGIDAGASATKWKLIDSSGVIASGINEAMDGHLYRQASVNRMERVLGEIVGKISGKRVNRIYMGITGAVYDGSIEKLLRGKFDAPSIVVSDMELAYRANFDQGGGILLYAGTGSAAYAIDEKGKAHQIGGWGYLLGDEGAGYWIGREAIRHSLLVIESEAEIDSKSLAGRILSEIEANDWNSVKRFVYSKDRSEIATLSKIVDQEAIRGNINAIKILIEAAGHLGSLVVRMDKILRGKALPVSFTGGICSSESINQELGRILNMRISISTIDIALCAAKFAHISASESTQL